MFIFRILFTAAIALAHMSAAGAIIFQDNFDGNQPGLSVVPIGGWTVSGGTVDIHGPGFYDLVPNNGSYVDLEGTRNAGVLSRSFSATTAAAYTATYTLAGSRLSFDPVNIVDVQFGSVTSTHTLLANDGPTTYSLTFLPSASGAATLTFSNRGVDDWGAFLLDVTVTGPVTEPPKPQYSFSDLIRNSVTRQVVTESSRQFEVGTFTPKFGQTLDNAKLIGQSEGLDIDHFNWYQVIREDTDLIRCINNNATCTDITKNAAGTILSLPYEDPPLGGYFNSPDDNLHGYYNASEYALPARGALPAVTTPTSFSFLDSPCSDTPGDIYRFSTYLSRVDAFGNLIVFVGGNTSFRWLYTQTSATDCIGTISHLKNLPSYDIVATDGVFDQIEFITVENIGADELAFLASEGVKVQFLDSGQPVPEPFTLSLLGVGLTAQMLIRLRKKRGLLIAGD